VGVGSQEKWGTLPVGGGLITSCAEQKFFPQAPGTACGHNASPNSSKAGHLLQPARRPLLCGSFVRKLLFFERLGGPTPDGHTTTSRQTVGWREGDGSFPVDWV
jgi:hypothetical protein